MPKPFAELAWRRRTGIYDLSVPMPEEKRVRRRQSLARDLVEFGGAAGAFFVKTYVEGVIEKQRAIRERERQIRAGTYVLPEMRVVMAQLDFYRALAQAITHPEVVGPKANEVTRLKLVKPRRKRESCKEYMRATDMAIAQMEATGVADIEEIARYPENMPEEVWSRPSREKRELLVSALKKILRKRGLKLKRKQ